MKSGLVLGRLHTGSSSTAASVLVQMELLFSVPRTVAFLSWALSRFWVRGLRILPEDVPSGVLLQAVIAPPLYMMGQMGWFLKFFSLGVYRIIVNNLTWCSREKLQKVIPWIDRGLKLHRDTASKGLSS